MAPATIVQDDDDEDSIESILAQIQAQEESEALARKLQEEWNAPGASVGSTAPRRPHSTPDDAIEISDGEGAPEDDEAMARRLAKEWEAEDVVLINPSLSQSKTQPCATRSGKRRAESHAPSELHHVTRVEQCRDLFTGEKVCSCGAKIPSARGHV